MRSPASAAQLLVEGTDPYHVFREFCGSWSLSEIEVRDFGGITQLRTYLDAYLAGKPQPNVSVGVAARKGYWDPQHPVFSGLRRFLITLNGAAGISGGPSDGPHNEVDSSGAAR